MAIVSDNRKQEEGNWIGDCKWIIIKGFLEQTGLNLLFEEKTIE